MLQIEVAVGQSNNQMVMSSNRLQVVFGSPCLIVEQTYESVKVALSTRK